MTLEKSIDFSPLAFYSLTNSKPLEEQMVQPSFLVLNSTSYLALLRNSTGYGSLVLGALLPVSAAAHLFLKTQLRSGGSFLELTFSFIACAMRGSASVASQ